MISKMLEGFRIHYKYIEYGMRNIFYCCMSGNDTFTIIIDELKKTLCYSKTIYSVTKGENLFTKEGTEKKWEDVYRLSCEREDEDVANCFLEIYLSDIWQVVYGQTLYSLLFFMCFYHYMQVPKTQE